MRRGLVRLSVNHGRTAPRIVTQMLAVDACSRGVLMRKQLEPFYEHVSVHARLNYTCDGRRQAFLRARCFVRPATPRSVAALCGRVRTFGARPRELPRGCQLHLLRCCNSRIIRILRPNQKQMLSNLKRITIALSFYCAFTTDCAHAGRQAAMLLIQFPHRKLGNAIVPRSEQPMRR